MSKSENIFGGLYMNDMTYSNKKYYDEIRTCSEPLYIYGAGCVAEDAFFILQKEGIPVDGFFVDDQYYNKKLNVAGNHVKKYSTIKEEYYNIVVGMGNYLKGKELQEKDGRVKSIFYLLRPSYRDDPEEIGRYILNNKEKYDDLMNYLADDISKASLNAYINIYLSGDMSHLFRVYRDGMGYFSNDIYKLDESMTFLDVGAYKGDTLAELNAYTNGMFDLAWCIELDKNYFDILCNEVNQLGVNDKVKCINGCMWFEAGKKMSFDAGTSVSQATAVSDNGEIEIVTTTLDKELSDRTRKIDLMKFNFKGDEFALMGAGEIIKNDHPIIAIVVGFSGNSLFDSYSFIKKMYSNYKFYLRFNRACAEFLVLYAVPKGTI